LPKILTLDEIKRSIDVPAMIQAIEDRFVLYSEGKVVVPLVGFLNFEDPPGDVHIKYGYVKSDDIYVLKIASGFYNNEKLGVPFADGVILIFSQNTGHLQLVLRDECWLTDMRTAAAGAVAARHLAPAKVRHIGIVGTGTQARMQLELLKRIPHIQKIDRGLRLLRHYTLDDTEKGLRLVHRLARVFRKGICSDSRGPTLGHWSSANHGLEATLEARLCQFLFQLLLGPHSGGEKSAGADDVSVELVGFLYEPPHGHVPAEVENVKAIRLEKRNHDGFADVVHVPFNRCDDHAPLGSFLSAGDRLVDESGDLLHGGS
jgi:hypothetical protein